MPSFDQTKVPTSRSDVFKSNQLSMIEKRVMMQFIQACLKDNDFKDLVDSESQLDILTFKQLIEAKKLSASITNFLYNAVAMSSDDDMSARKVDEKLKN